MVVQALAYLVTAPIETWIHVFEITHNKELGHARPGALKQPSILRLLTINNWLEWNKLMSRQENSKLECDSLSPAYFHCLPLMLKWMQRRI
jgi:hypothetical protein